MRGLGLVVLLMGVPGGAQEVPRAAAATYRIAGRVVSAADGHALQRATVMLEGVQGGGTIAAGVSGEQGEFAFEGMRAGKYSLLGEARGYLPGRYEEHEGYSTAIVTGAAVATEGLVLRLTPAAMLSGRVLDEAGEPVRSAQVTLYREGQASGKRQIGPVNMAQTDDRGEYTMGSLAAGRYFLGARAVPWYAVHPAGVAGPPVGSISLLGDVQRGDSPVLTGVDPALDVAYPTTFYPDVTESSAASAIPVKGGEQMHLDLHLLPVRAGRILLHMTPGEQVSYPQLLRPVFDSFDMVMGEMRGSDGVTEMVGLPPGRYEMRQTDPKTGAAVGTRMIDLTTGSLEMEPAPVPVPGVVKIQLQEAGGGKLPASVQVMLRTKMMGNPLVQAADAKGEAEFPAVSPDEYGLMVFGGNQLLQVGRAEQGGKRLPKDRVRVAAGETAAVTVVITSTQGVEGLALRDGKPAAGAMIVLVPVDAIDETELFRRDQSDLDGTFLLPSVAAGRYIVVAIDDGWKLEWGRPEVLARYLGKGVPVEILGGERRPVHLAHAIAVQAR